MNTPDMFREQREVWTLFPQTRRIPLPGLTGLPPNLEIPHRNFVILPRFADDHPFSPPHIYLQPFLRSRHYYVHDNETFPRLCWCRPEQWSPRFRLIVAVTAAMRFLNDWHAGLVD